MDATLNQAPLGPPSSTGPDTDEVPRPPRARNVGEFPDLANRAARVAGGLAALGVKHGDTVAIVMPTVPEFTDVFFGVLHLGAIPVPLYPPVRLGRLDEHHTRTAAMLKLARSAILVTDERAGRLMGTTVAGCDRPVQLVRARVLLNPTILAAPPTGGHRHGPVLIRNHR